MQDPFIDTERDARDGQGERPRIDKGLREELQENLLNMEEREAAEKVFEDWDDSTILVRSLSAQWKANRLRARGFTGVSVVKAQDENRVHVPRGATPSMAALNKAARLRRRLASTLFSDRALPDPVPSGSDDEDRDAAQFSGRLLVDLDSEGKLDNNRTHRRAYTIASDYGSGFIHYQVDETGGGMGPVMAMAAPGAPNLEVAELDPEALAHGVQQEYSGDLVIRYVREDETLTDDPKEAKKIWYPALRYEILDGRHVRFHPSVVPDVWMADGVSIGAMVPLGNLKRDFPEILDWPEERLNALTGHRPNRFEDLIPHGKRKKLDRLRGDERLVFVITRYHKQSMDYEKGAYVIAAGGKFILHRSEWYDDVNDEPVDIPLSQVKQIEDDEDNPYGQGIMEFLGPGNEIRARILEMILDHMDKFTHMKTFVPMTSNLQAKQLQSSSGTYIPIAPGGEPKYEKLPDLPRSIEKVFAMVTDDLDDESGLQEAGQGLEAPNVTSGKQQQAIVAQVIIGLSDFRENIMRAFQRSWRVQLQLVRWRFETPQRISWDSENNQYREKVWTGSDLRGTKDVRILRGSFTQLAPVQKDALISRWLQEQRITPQEARELGLEQVGVYMGLDGDEHKARIRRQLDRWSEGPPAGWAPPQPVVTGVDPATGQPVLQTPPDPVVSKLFDQNPSDEIRPVALVRTDEISKFMATVDFNRHPGPWQAVLAQEFQRARHAAGVFTLQEQMQIQAQQAQQQQAEARRQEGREDQTQRRTEAREDQREGRDRQAEAQKAALGARGQQEAAAQQTQRALIQARAGVLQARERGQQLSGGR
jgi:hypothetical protein